jgi:hypothetical protein
MKSISIAVAVDLAKKIITIDGVGWPITGDASRETIVAMAPDKGSATLNRITGALNAHFIQNTGLKKFYGECKPAQKFFLRQKAYIAFAASDASECAIP